MEGILGAGKSSSGCDMLERLPGRESAVRVWKALNVTREFIPWKLSLLYFQISGLLFVWFFYSRLFLSFWVFDDFCGQQSV